MEFETSLEEQYIFSHRHNPNFDLDKVALVVIDMQYCDASRYHGLGKILGAETSGMADYYFDRLEGIVIPTQVKLLECFRENHLKVVFVAVGADLPDFSDLAPKWKNNAIPLEGKQDAREARTWFHKGEFEFSILSELAPGRDELVIHKRTSGVFNSSSIDSVLRNMGIDTLVFVGVATNGCVLGAVVVAADLGYKCVIVEDGCATPQGKVDHDIALHLLSGTPSNAAVLTADRLLAQIKIQSGMIDMSKD